MASLAHLLAQEENKAPSAMRVEFVKPVPRAQLASSAQMACLTKEMMASIGAEVGSPRMGGKTRSQVFSDADFTVESIRSTAPSA